MGETGLSDKCVGITQDSDENSYEEYKANDGKTHTVAGL